MVANTATSRRIVVETKRHLSHIRTYEHGLVPLTNPGVYRPGVYRGDINLGTRTATMTPEVIT
jgi:energy-converting hydrogenase Eha subunit F